MKIRPRNIPKFLTGNKLWYQGILDYDPTKYVSAYDTSRLVNGDMKDTNLTPWKSNISGYDLGRYLPTTGYGAYGKNGPHYNYTKGVEGQGYYRQFGEDLLDANGNFTETGLAWAKAVDALLPSGSNASFFDSNGQLRNNWTVGHNDAHNRNRLRNYTKLSDYVNDIRYDQILGARHNVFLRKGKRYFYTDNEGNRHWVDPEEAKKYTISKDPVELGWEGTTYWDDYELTGPESPTGDGSTDVGTGHKDKYGFDWDKLKNTASKLLNNPNLYANGRLLGSLISNEKIYNEALQGIKPALRQTYNTYRLVVGDEASKLAYYRRAAAGQTKAALPFTSDADRQTAYMQEARRVGDELRALGDLIDNQEIRRTSDESNLHQWANTLRATEVANANIASIILANALRHNLLAQKHAAQWSSIDNHLKGIETRKWRRLADQQAIDDLIFALTELLNLANNSKILTALQNLQIILDKHTTNGITDWNDNEVKDAIRKFNEIKNLEIIESLNRRKNYYLNRGTVFAKSGTKITRKSKDDLLYKSARDVVEHFRKISKMASDSYNRRTPKIEKLTPHPKGSTRKYLLGGLAPFVVYTPVALGGETSTTSQTSTSDGGNSSKKDKNETLDMVKELFKTMQGKGLPSDVNNLYVLMLNFLGRARAFGEDVSTDDIASMYLSLMHQVNNIEYLKSAHDASEKTLIQNGGENEFAVDFRGYLVCLSEEGDIKYAKSIADAAEKKLNPLTNHLLSQMRAIDPKLAARTDLDGVIANGVGILKIAEFLKSLLPNLGSTQTTIPGYTKKGTNDVINGLSLLLEAPEGVYEYTKHSKELNELVKMAISYLKGILPQNMRSIIKARADYSRLTGLPGANEDLLITSLVASGYNSETTYTLEGVTGLAATKKGDGTGSKGSGTGTPSSVLFLLGNGYLLEIEFNIGNSQSVKTLGRYGVLLDKEKNNLGQGSTFLDVSKSLFGPILDLDKATFGGSRLNSTAYSHILLNNSDCVGVDLPVKKDLNGNYIPDFQLLLLVEKAEELISNNNITNPQQINSIYRNLGLQDKFDSNGNLITLNYRRFAAILVTLDSKALKGEAPINTNEVSEADDVERELFIETMQNSGNKDYDLSDGILWSSWGRDKLYKGTVFIPVREDLVHGYISGGLPLDTDLPNNSNQVAIMQYAPKVLQYLQAPPLSSLK